MGGERKEQGETLVEELHAFGLRRRKTNLSVGGRRGALDAVSQWEGSGPRLTSEGSGGRQNSQ